MLQYCIHYYYMCGVYSIPLNVYNLILLNYRHTSVALKSHMNIIAINIALYIFEMSTVTKLIRFETDQQDYDSSFNNNLKYSMWPAIMFYALNSFDQNRHNVYRRKEIQSILPALISATIFVNICRIAAHWVPFQNSTFEAFEGGEAVEGFKQKVDDTYPHLCWCILIIHPITSIYSF